MTQILQFPHNKNQMFAPRDFYRGVSTLAYLLVMPSEDVIPYFNRMVEENELTVPEVNVLLCQMANLKIYRKPKLIHYIKKWWESL